MKPFLLLGTRADDLAADGEYESFLRITGLPESALVRLRLEREPMPPLDPADFSGIILGGGPFNSSDPIERKSAVQLRVERELRGLLDVIVPADLPFLGACYGVGTLGTHVGATVDTTYSEPVGATTITLTDAGREDPLLAGLPAAFDSFVGHKEAIRELPPHAVRLAASADCPVQMFRVGSNVYATQFHPELDAEALCIRVDVYANSGYFHPGEAEGIKAAARAADVAASHGVLRRFVELYARD